MAHHIYHTRGIILGSVPIGESNRFYKIFTEELGLVGASAQAIREGKSKLRYALQNYSWIFVDLVRGKEVWRITSAREEDVGVVVKHNGNLLKPFARICALVLRLVHGEVRDDALFQELLNVAKFLDLGIIPGKLVASFEALVAVRILVQQGYLEPIPYQKYVDTREFSVEMLEAFEPLCAQAIIDINNALHESHL